MKSKMNNHEKNIKSTPLWLRVLACSTCHGIRADRLRAQLSFSRSLSRNRFSFVEDLRMSWINRKCTKKKNNFNLRNK